MNAIYRERAIGCIGLLAVLGTGAIFGMVLTLPIAGFGQTALNFLGSIVGAFFAAGTAIAAIEWERRRRERSTTEIVTDLFDQALGASDDYFAWANADESQPHATAIGALTVVAGCAREAISIARDLRSSTRGMARIVLLLEHEMPRVTMLEERLKATGAGDLADAECSQTVYNLTRAILVGRGFLERSHGL